MAGKSLRALIVEAEVLIALDVERIVGSIAGCDIDLETVARLDTQRPDCDLLLCSVDEPGSPLLDSLRNAAADGVAIVVLTTADELINEGLPWPCVPKPFRSDELVAAVLGAIEARSA